MTDFLQCKTYPDLVRHALEIQKSTLNDLFASDSQRASGFSLQATHLFLDYAKHPVTTETLRLLMRFARERAIEPRREAMFAGKKINTTEQRAVLHTALRQPFVTTEDCLCIDGVNIYCQIYDTLSRMRCFTEQVRMGQWLGFSGKPMTDIVNIGIGGSDLGPRMVCHALRPYWHPFLKCHFVANLDGHDLDAVLSDLNPETTLFLVISKSFTTLETRINLQSAQRWFLKGTESPASLRQHFIVVSANPESVTAAAIAPECYFPFWDWVGGRYSVWSAVGLSIALMIGFEAFTSFLLGASDMDQHFQDAPLEKNMPVILAMLGVWQQHFFQRPTLCIVPYCQDLSYFPSYLQQLEMESNGKQTQSMPTVSTCPILWGGVGTNTQHTYFQCLHQGSHIVPVDFIAALKPHHDLPDHHAALLANCFAQSQALMVGKACTETPYRDCPGNRPSNTLLMDKLTPATCGALMALYEHKVFVQGIMWGVNSFDQWGVEWGKMLATNIQTALVDSKQAPNAMFDSSTAALVARARQFF